MMRSLFSGVAGLRTHQTRMDVIGNNIANVNTTAYKSQSMVFTDLLYQTTQAASGANPNTGKGGTNARQIGLGSTTGAISTAIATQGSAQTTNNPFDLMISGDNFFIVNNGSENFFTRDGAFTVDNAGNLVTSTSGFIVQGWQADKDGNIIRSQVSGLKVMSPANMTYEPEATSKAMVNGIVDKMDPNVNSDAGLQISIPLYDNLGYKYNAIFSMHAADGDKGEYYMKLEKLMDSDGNDATETSGISFGDPNGDPMQITVKGIKKSVTDNQYKLRKDEDGYHLYQLDADGKIPDGASPVTDTATIAKAYGMTDAEIAKITTSADYPAPAIDDNGRLVYYSDSEVENAIKVKYNPATGDFGGVSGDSDANFSDISDNDKTWTIQFTNNAFNKDGIAVDLSTTTMWDNNGISTMSGINGDENNLGSGRKVGDMSGISISSAGLITASYDNGQTRVLGQIATAVFANPSGLEKRGDNLYSATMNSGDFDGIGVDITANGGKMTSGVLEMSNVDLSNEFTTMITTQRGFQANSRIITVSDTLLEELVNLKR